MQEVGSSNLPSPTILRQGFGWRATGNDHRRFGCLKGRFESPQQFDGASRASVDAATRSVEDKTPMSSAHPIGNLTPLVFWVSSFEFLFYVEVGCLPEVGK